MDVTPGIYTGRRRESVLFPMHDDDPPIQRDLKYSLSLEHKWLAGHFANNVTCSV